jgi:hypothetical protein
MTKTGKWTGTKKVFLEATVITGDTPRVPRYSSHTNVSRNILSGDSDKYKYVPYLGDQGPNDDTNLRRLLKEMEEHYSHGRIESARLSEFASRIAKYLEAWLSKSKVINEEVLVHYIVSQESAIRLGLREEEREMLLKSFGEPLSEQTADAVGSFWEAFDEVFGINLPNVVLPLERLKEMVEHVSKKTNASPEKPVPAPGDRLGTYASLTCLICGAVDCQTHADYSHDEIPNSRVAGDEEREPEYLVQRQPLVLPYNDMMRRYNIREKAKLDSGSEFELPRRPRKKAPCSEDCWRTNGDLTTRQSDWGSKDLSLLGELLIGVIDKDRACQIAFASGLPCWKVYTEIEAHENDAPALVEEPFGRAKRPDWYDNKRKTLHNNFQDMTKAHLHQERSQSNPVSRDL